MNIAKKSCVRVTVGHSAPLETRAEEKWHGEAGGRGGRGGRGTFKCQVKGLDRS